MDQMKRRRWANTGATIPLERSLVPYGGGPDLISLNPQPATLFF